MDNPILLAHGAFPRQVLEERFRNWERWIKWRRRYVEGICSTIPAGKTVIDLGAGCGHFVRALRERGYEAYGLDATEGILEITNKLVGPIDLTRNCAVYHGAVDWALFLEVGEHVPKDLEQKLIDNVARIPREGLIVSWSIHANRGIGHVNPQRPKYVAAEFAKRGWTVDEEATAKLRFCGSKNDKRTVRVLCRSTQGT